MVERVHARIEDAERNPEEELFLGLGERIRVGRGRARADLFRNAEVRRELIRMGAPRKPPRADAVKLMLAETRDAPFSAEGWLFELKLDGYRLLAVREGPDARLISRNGNDLSASFPR